MVIEEQYKQAIHGIITIVCKHTFRHITSTIYVVYVLCIQCGV